MSNEEAAPGPAAEPAAELKWPAWWVLGLQLAALWSLGLVRPLFDVLGSDEAFFVARGNTPSDILIFAIGLTFIPPLVLTLVELAVSAASSKAARQLHVLFVALLAALLAMQFIKGIFAGALPVIAISLLIGALVGWAFLRTAGMRSFLTVLTPAPFIFLALFLFTAPISNILMPSTEGSGSSDNPGESGNSTPVVLVIFDELPNAVLMNADTSINAERFPNFAKLAATSTWYKNNTTVSDSTFSAVPAILTGKTPPDDLRKLSAAQVNELYRDNIYTMLAASHRIGNVEAITHICPPALCAPKQSETAVTRLQALYSDLSVVTGRTVLPKSLADQLPSIDATYGDFSPAQAAELDSNDKKNANANPKARFENTPPIAEVPGADANNNGLRQVAGLQNSITGAGKPPLYVMHMLMPHVPWRFGPTGDQYYPNGSDAPGLEGVNWTTNEYLTNVALQRFILQTQYTDKIVASIVERMKKAGIWDRSLFIITADHGVSFRPGGSRRPVTQETLAEIANQPMFVKYPGQKKGIVSTAPTSNVDVAPTIAAVTKTGQNLKFDGVPFNDPQPTSEVAVRNGRQAARVTAPSADLMARRDQLAREWSATFPSGQDALYRLGPNPNLIGQQVSALGKTTTSARATVKFGNLYSNIPHKSAVVQIYFVGNTSGLAPGTPLAAAVDGKIVAVGEAYNTPGGGAFGIVLPPQSLRGSSAKVSLYSVSGGSTLAPLASAGR